jgi:broad specificity phosphatase PhoE
LKTFILRRKIGTDFAASVKLDDMSELQRKRKMFNFDPSRQLIGWMLRHGELPRMDIWDSWGSYALSEEGKAQAEKAAQWLSFERIGRVIASDLPRTIQTAQYLMDSGCVACPFLSTDPNLRARKVGYFEGKTKTPERLAEYQKYADDPTLVIPDGESGNQLKDRVQVAYQYLATPYNCLPTALVLHNSVIKCLMGLDGIKEACSPGGLIGVYLDEKGEMSFEVLLGKIEMQEGIS